MSYTELTIAEIVESVALNLGFGDPSSTQEDYIERWLNRVQKIICRSVWFSCTERTDSSMVLQKGVSYYSLPPQVGRIINARLIDDTCYVLDNCESGWTADATDSVVITYDSKYRHQGRYSMKMVTASAPTDKVHYSENKSLAITAFTVYSASDSSRTIVTSASHGRSNGDQVTISGTTSYDGTYIITTVGTDTFVINKTFVANDATGYWCVGPKSCDLSGITSGALGFWIYSDSALLAGALAITITEDANGAETTNYVTSTLPAIRAYQWQYVQLTGIDLTDVGMWKSIGIKALTDIHGTTAKTFYIDSINLYKLEYGGNNWPFKIVYSNVLDNHISNPAYAGTNTPYTMVIHGTNDGANSFEVSPIPDDNYPIWIRYHKWPELIDEGNNSTISSELTDLEDVLIAGATWLGFMQERDWKSATEWKIIFQHLLNTARINDYQRKGIKPQLVGYNTSGGGGRDFELPVEGTNVVRGTETGFYSL